MRLRKENREFDDSLDDVTRSCFENNDNKNKKM
jgi:hypothetical protein